MHKLQQATVQYRPRVSEEQEKEWEIISDSYSPFFNELIN